jgi:hypothetical protein
MGLGINISFFIQFTIIYFLYNVQYENQHQC